MDTATMNGSTSRPLFSMARLTKAAVVLGWLAGAPAFVWVGAILIGYPLAFQPAPFAAAAMLFLLVAQLMRCPICDGFIAKRDGRWLGMPRLDPFPRTCGRCSVDLRRITPWTRAPKGDLAARMDFNRRHGVGPQSFSED